VKIGARRPVMVQILVNGKRLPGFLTTDPQEAALLNDRQATVRLGPHKTAYDAGGHRTSVGGSLANVNIPATAL
jgi:hypothetical protein